MDCSDTSNLTEKNNTPVSITTPATTTTAAAAAAVIAIATEDATAISSSYCFCLHPDKSSDFFRLNCPHSFHKSCLRQLLRSEWEKTVSGGAGERGGPPVVDTKNRKVLFVTCPLCRTFLSPTILRQLQKQLKFFCVQEMLPSTFSSIPPIDSTILCTVVIQEKESGKVLHSKNYILKHLPTLQIQLSDAASYRCRSVSNHSTKEEEEKETEKKELYDFFPIVTEAPLSSYSMTLKMYFSSAPDTILFEKHTSVLSKDCMSSEMDARAEEAQDLLIERLFVQNKLRIITPELQEEEYRMKINSSSRYPAASSSSPPLPSLEEIFPHFQRFSSPHTTPTPTTSSPTPSATPALTAPALAAMVTTTIHFSTSLGESIQARYPIDTITLEDDDDAGEVTPSVLLLPPPPPTPSQRPAAAAAAAVVPEPSQSQRIESPYWKRTHHTNPTTAPSSSSRRISPCLSVRRRKTESEKKSDYLRTQQEKEMKLKKKIQKNMQKSLQHLSTLTRHIHKWSHIQKELYLTYPSPSSYLNSVEKLRMKVDHQFAVNTLHTLHCKFQSLSEIFPS